MPLERAMTAPQHVALAAAQKQWPRVSVEADGFVAHAKKHFPDTDGYARALAGPRGPDLVLAYACSQQDPHALAAFEAVYGPHVDAILASVVKSASARDETRQAFRKHLFLPVADGQLRIARYAGRGSLLAFVRAVALRVALSSMQSSRQPELSENLDARAALAPDLLAQYSSKLYAAECKLAFADALKGLPPRTRTLLRYHVVDQLSIDQIGAIYQVHRATAARWVQSAREEMIGATRKVLMAHLQVDRKGLESVLRLVGSELDVSAERLLRETKAA